MDKCEICKLTVLTKLTKRELEVMESMARSYTNKQIAGELFVSLKTIEHHINSIYGKLNPYISGYNKRAAVVRIYLKGIEALKEVKGLNG